MGAPLRLHRPSDVRLDAWRGLAKWCILPEGRAARITAAEYAEWGPDYARNHALMPGGPF